MFTVYIVRTNKNTLYIGQTLNLKKRLHLHKVGKGSKYLRGFESFELVHAEKYKTRNAAMKREIELKKLTKAQKERLLSGSR